jgi:transposase-like protein
VILPRPSRHSTKRVIFKIDVTYENQKRISQPVVRNKYTPQFKELALERADKDGIPKVAQDLGLAESMLYSWRSKRRQTLKKSLS